MVEFELTNGDILDKKKTTTKKYKEEWEESLSWRHILKRRETQLSEIKLIVNDWKVGKENSDEAMKEISKRFESWEDMWGKNGI